MSERTIGRLWQDPSLLTMTDEERIAYTQEMIQNGPPVAGAVFDATPTTPSESVPSGIFDPETDLADASAYRAVWYTFANGKRVAVHPVSVVEAAEINRRVVREIGEMGLLRENLRPEEVRAQARDQGIELQFRGYVWQTIFCCRQDLNPASPRVFKHKHADMLRNNPGFAEDLQAITKLSDSLAKGKSEADLLREGLVRFFGLTESWLKQLTGQLESGAGTSLQDTSDALSDFAITIGSWKQPGVLPETVLSVASWHLSAVQDLEETTAPTS